jgi:hypothetical protein
VATPTNLSPTPTFSGTVQQQFIIEPLRGGRDVTRYLDRFPEEIYSRSLDSHLVKYLQVLLGNNGVNWLRKNYLEARLKLEELGVELFDLDSFFGDPIGFGRILEETYDRDPEGLISKEDWDRIKTKDASYRSRALDFFQAARLGNTREGLRLASKAGLGHEVEAIENFRWLFDQHSDDPLGLDRFGQTLSTEEVVILPRRELPRNETQRVILISTGPIDLASDFLLSLPVGNAPHQSLPIPAQATRDQMRIALENIAVIGEGGVQVSGPVIHDGGQGWHWDVTFTSNTDYPLFDFSNGVTSTDPSALIDLSVETIITGGSATDEVVQILPRELHHLQEALDRIKAVTTIPTMGEARGTRSRQAWNSVHSTSNYAEVVRYVTGNPNILWPETDQNINWIEANVEHEGPRTKDGLNYTYQGFHNAQSARAYTEGVFTNLTAYEASDSFSEAFPASHLGQFLPAQVSVYPFLGSTAVGAIFTPEMALVDSPELPQVSDMAEVQSGDTHSFINRIYPSDYLSLPGVQTPVHRNDRFWSSLERTEGTDYLELDLGSVQAVNYISMEVANKPIKISIAFDALDQAPRRRFLPVRATSPFDNHVYSGEPSLNPWRTLELAFTNGRGGMIFTRFIRIGFERIVNPADPFLFDPINGVSSPWSVEVRNLRIGRNGTGGEASSLIESSDDNGLGGDVPLSEGLIIHPGAIL